jgi:DNA-binding SARP family transcriptional activator
MSGAAISASVSDLGRQPARALAAVPGHNAQPQAGVEPAALELRLLGGFELTVEGDSIALPESAQRLVAFLALRNRPQTRLKVAGTLWPDRADRRAMANLRSTLWRARLPDGGTVLETRGSLIGVSPAVRTDVGALAGLRPCAAPVEVVGGSTSYEPFLEELLPGWYEDWTLIERERLAQIQLRVAEVLAAEFAAVGDLIAATDIAYLTVALDPLGVVRDRILAGLDDAS